MNALPGGKEMPSTGKDGCLKNRFPFQITNIIN